MLKDFKDKVYNIVRKIPRGKTLSYKKVAEKAGRPKAWRSVGNILNKNKNLDISCHRVIKNNGQVGGYNKGRKKKLSILNNEGIKF